MDEVAAAVVRVVDATVEAAAVVAVGVDVAVDAALDVDVVVTILVALDDAGKVVHRTLVLPGPRHHLQVEIQDLATSVRLEHGRGRVITYSSLPMRVHADKSKVWHCPKENNTANSSALAILGPPAIMTGLLLVGRWSD
jgi:hypothetical protein